MQGGKKKKVQIEGLNSSSKNTEVSVYISSYNSFILHNSKSTVTGLGHAIPKKPIIHFNIYIIYLQYNFSHECFT